MTVTMSAGLLILRLVVGLTLAVHGTQKLFGWFGGPGLTGLTQGFEKHLDIVGIGYRAELKGRTVQFTLGYSHPIDFPIPEGISVTVEKQTHLVLTGYDRQALGQTAANIRALRKPDPYKNKGIRYVGEVLKKKAGKAGGK